MPESNANAGTVLVGVSLLLLVPSVSAQDGVEAQLEEQSRRIDELEAQLFSSLDSGQRSFEEILGRGEIHGFLAQGYMDSSENNYLVRSRSGSWAFHEMGINYMVDLDQRTRTGIQLFSRDLGPVGNNELLVDWAMLDFHWDDLLGLRFGKIKVPHGLYNETRDIGLLRNAILLPQSVYNEPFRDAMAGLWGLGLYGGAGQGALGRLEYQAQIGTTELKSDGGISRAIEDGVPIDVKRLEMDYTWAAGLRWSTPVDGLLLSATSLITNITTTGTLNENLVGPLVAGTNVVYDISDTRYSVLSAEYTWNDLILAAEYWQSTINIDFDANLDEGVVVPISELKLHEEGYYLGAAQRFADWFELGAYYSIYFPDADNHSGDEQVAPNPDFKAWSKDFALTARFDIDDNWVFKLEGHRIDGVAGVFNADNPQGYDRDWTLFVAKLAVSF
jgi:hypothetical protein